ncbi:hypothetical protein lerEdw1_011924 [Lerista edwardsae]|nr:hypothetical protein lerEdw1_011924 [Lerista edwardsae]
MCDKQNAFTMCPLCDKTCDYWNLSTACGTARASHLFDNPATVFFSIFMALWGKLCFNAFMVNIEMKGQSGCKLENGGFAEADEEDKLTWKDRTPGYLVNCASILFMVTLLAVLSFALVITKFVWTVFEPIQRFALTSTVFVCFISFQISLTFSLVFGVIVYRITTAAALSMSTNESTKSNVRVTVTATAVIINLVVILILDEIYGMVAKWLTKMEVPKTEKAFEERLIMKAFLLKFVNSYAPIFYVAFFKGRFVGRPGHYVYVFAGYRMEECAPGGCLMELCIQLSIIMLGKQLIQNNIFEIGVPKLKKLFRKLKDERPEKKESDSDSSKQPQQWELDYVLEPFTGLTPEYMEMIIQFGFVTLFVASFPLAPVFALLNNVIEVRLDAKKFVAELRRPDAVRAKDIGIWFNILSGIGKFSVIINDKAPHMGNTSLHQPSESLPWLENYPRDRTLNFPTDLCHAKQVLLPGVLLFCRFKDYREPPWSENQYEFSKQYWAVLSARLAFVIIFQNLVMFLSVLVDWLIPDIPKDISEQIKKEKSELVDFFLKEEHEKLKLIEHFILRDKQKSKSETRVRRSRAASFCQFSRSKRGSFTSFSSQHTDV